MSSFIINKESYARCAGVLAAIGSQKDYYGEKLFYKYDAKKGDIYGIEDFKNEIMSLYELSAKSVALQYNEAEWSDPKDYSAAFEDYFIKAIKVYKRAYVNGSQQDKAEFNRLCYYVNDFFSSVGYQIEDLNCCRKAFNIMNWYSRALLRVMKKINEDQDSMCWGSFDYFEEERE